MVARVYRGGIMISGSSRVFRGGSWGYGADFCGVSIRGSSHPDYRYYNDGFRICIGGVL